MDLASPPHEDCLTIAAFMWPYLDCELPPRRRRIVAIHLGHCARCREEFAFHRAFLRVVRASLRQVDRVDTLAADVLRAIERDRAHMRDD